MKMNVIKDLNDMKKFKQPKNKELAFSNSMYEFFSRLPLGSIKKYDYFHL